MTLIPRSAPAQSRPARFTSVWLKACRFIAQRIVLRLVIRSALTVRVSGRERLRGLSGTFIVVANHSSHLDAPLIFSSLPERVTRNLATGAAADYFFISHWKRWLTILFFNAFEVHRIASSNPKRSISKRLLEDGIPILLFPEGTRSRTGEVAEFKAGAAALAIQQQIPAIPIALIGLDRAMPPGSSWPGPGRPNVEVVIGAPMRDQRGESVERFNARLAAKVLELKTESRIFDPAHGYSLTVPAPLETVRDLAKVA